MSQSSQARLGELDGALDSQQITPQLAEELFAVVDVLDNQPALRRVLTDPGIEPTARDALIEQLFGAQVSPATLHVLREATKLRWGGGAALAAAFERLGVRAVAASSVQAGTLDQVEDELFRFGRLVEGDVALRAAISDRSAPVSARQQLVSDLLDGKADTATVFLARRAAGERSRNFEITLESYLNVVAAERGRAVAHVVVARPLTEEQLQRLTEVLGSQLGRPVSLQVAVDPAVLGGVRVTVGDEVIEGTLSTRLAHARREIS